MVGDLVWTLGEIAPARWNNINDLLNEIGLAEGNLDDYSSYALITPRIGFRSETTWI